jgi:hypothetical protein
VYNSVSSSPNLLNATATASSTVGSGYGAWNSGLTTAPVFRDSRLTGSTSSIHHTSSATTRVTNSVLGGPVSGTGFTCVGVHDLALTPLNRACTTQNLTRMVLVAKAGGDFTTVQAALDSITDASASNPYLIKIAPGVYTGRVTLKSHVDIEGSGEGVTILTAGGGTNDAFTDGSSATVRANNVAAEVRHLTIANTGGSSSATAVWNVSSPNILRLTHVTATVSGGTTSHWGLYAAASPILTDVTITTAGFGIFLDGSASPTLHDVDVTSTSDVAIEVSGFGAAPVIRLESINDQHPPDVHRRGSDRRDRRSSGRRG